MPECRSTPDTPNAPSAPSGLVANGTTTSIVVAWNANAVSELVTAYKVYRSTNRGGPFTLKTTTKNTTYTDSTASSNTLYWYRVTAVNNAGEGQYSDVEASFLADVTAPENPTILTTTIVGTTNVKNTWSASSDSDLAGYNIYARIFPAAYTKLNTELLTVLEYTHNSATAGSTWDYKVTAVDTAGNESTGSTVSIAVPASDTTAPSVPATPTAINESGGIRVNWTPNTEPDLHSYRVYRSDDSYTASLGTVLAAAGGTYLDATAVVGQSYSYKVDAKDTSNNASGKSGASNSVTRTTSTIGSLTSFLKAGEMVPCVVHGRGVSRYTYSSGKNSSGVTVVTATTNEDFDALTAGTVLTAKYAWNFAAGTGQAQGKYPQLNGWNGAHAYDQAGTYTVTLTRTDQAGNVSSYQASVILSADTRRVVYVASNGDGGSSSNGGTTSSPVNIARANAILATTENVKIVLKRGDTFYGNTTLLTLKKKNQMITSSASWGTGALPRVGFNDVGTAGRCPIKVESTALNAVIEQIDFGVNYTGGTKKNDFAIRIVGEVNALIRDCTISSFGSFVEPTDGNIFRWVLIQDNKTTGNKSLHNSLCYVRGDDVVILGNYIHNSRAEHPIRWASSCRTLTAFNHLRNLQYNANYGSPWSDLDTSDIVKTAANVQQGYHHYLWRNTLECSLAVNEIAGTVQIGPLNEKTGHVAEYVQYICLDRNTIVNASVDIQPGCSYVMCRNNICSKHDGYCFEIDQKGQSPSDTYPENPDGTVGDGKITVGDSGVDADGNYYQDRVARYIYIYNNTCINNGKSGQPLRIKDFTRALNVQNNIFIAASLTATGKLSQQSACCYLGNTDTTSLTLTQNLFPAFDKFLCGGSNTFEAMSKFNTRTGIANNVVAGCVLDSAYKIPTASVAKTLARPVSGVFEDYYGTARSSQAATWMAGAVEGSY